MPFTLMPLTAKGTEPHSSRIIQGPMLQNIFAVIALSLNLQEKIWGIKFIEFALVKFAFENLD